MKKRDIEKLIISQRDNIVPDVLKNIMEKASVPSAAAGARVKKETGLRFKFFKLAAAICAAAAIFTFGAVYYNYGNAEADTLYVDINPSFALTVNRNNRVLSVTETGAEDTGLAQSLKGMDAEDAVISIMDYAVRKGYFEDGSGAVSVSAEKGSKNEERLKSMETRLKGFFSEKNIECEIIGNTYTKEDRKEAEDNEVSPGKMKIINRIIELDSDEDVNTLKGKSIRELNDILKGLLDAESGKGGNNPDGNGEGGGNKENGGNPSGASGEDSEENGNNDKQDGQNSGNGKENEISGGVREG